MKKLFLAIIAAVFSFAAVSFAQSSGSMKEVQGVIKDNLDAPVPGAFVTVSGTTRGTMSDMDGKFSIKVSDKETLEVSCIGYVTAKIAVGSQSRFNIVLREDSQMLEETVVIGYGSQRKIDLTGSVDQVGKDVFDARPSSNVTQMLEGAVPNLNIALEDGKPIRSADFNIRGVTSIGQEASALVLIDGVEGNPAYLNPNDIESVSVLKDAASSTIYGSRAAFGVVLITTKNASKERVQVIYSNNFTFSRPVVVPDYVTDGFLWASMFYEGYYNCEGTKPEAMNTVQPFSIGWLTEYRRRHDCGDFGTVVSDGSWGISAGNYAYFPEGTDWFGLLYKKYTFSQTHNLSVSGSSDKFDYSVSGRIYKYDGLYNSATNTDDCSSQNIRVKVGYQAYKWLKITNNFEQGHRYYDNPCSSEGAAGNIWSKICVDGAVSVPLYNPDGTFTKAGASTVGGFLYGTSKSVYETEVVKNTLGFRAEFLDKKLSLNGDATYSLEDYNGYVRQYPDKFSQRPGVLETNAGVTSSIEKDHHDKKYISANLFADYTNTFGNHYLKALVGYNYEQREYSRFNAYNTDLLDENVERISLSFGTEKKKVTDPYNKWRSVGLFSRINYSFKDRYLLQFNCRYDGTSKFPANERWAFFPSVSGGWRFSEEPWMANAKRVMSNGKIRFSYGSLGNSNISPYFYDETLGIGNSRLLNGTIYRKTSSPSPVPTNLTWETATTYDVGMDLGFFQDRLTISGDWFLRKTKDMFTDGPTIQAVYGADSPKGNYAELSTRGFELTITWKDRFNLASKPFNYTVKATLADNVSKIDRFNNDLKYIGGRNAPEYYEGMIMGELWGFEVNGLWQSQEEIDAAEAGARAAGQSHYDGISKLSKNYEIHPGDMKFEDLNGNGYIDRGDQTVGNSGDRRIIGNSSPRFRYSFNFSADWNNFFVSVFFQGVGKQDFFGTSPMLWGQYNRGYNQIPKWQLGNYWTEDNRDAWLPRYSSRTDPFYQAGRRGNTRYMLDVSYIRLKNVQFGYSLPQKWIKPLHLTKASIFFSGENLWDWSPMYKHVKNALDVLGLGTDPENSDSTAGAGGCYPVMASYSFGFNLTF